jgi:hypothetical protein
MNQDLAGFPIYIARGLIRKVRCLGPRILTKTYCKEDMRG